MTTSATTQFLQEIEKHRNILNVWKAFGESNAYYSEAKQLYENTLDMKLRDCGSREGLYEFKMKMNLIYIKFFGKECDMSPEEIIDDWAKRAKKCEVISKNGSYGYQVYYNPNTDKTKSGTNYLNNDSYKYGANDLVSGVDINKIILTDLEKLAKEIIGCTITISEEKKEYYYSYD